MRNATLDTLNRKTDQLAALVSMLGSMAGCAFEELTEAERGNYTWVMADLVRDISAALATEAEAHRHD